jgi:NAD(P)-dependent dehydrogenase (short-subunit alcohol dehydrogenase family)
MWLKGKAALITGASRGIGRGIATKLAENGAAKICINYLTNEAAANETLSVIRQAGADGFICKADVSDPAAIERMYEQIRSKFGTLDVLVSNARIELATGFYQSPLEIPLDKFELTFNSQVRAFHVLTRHMVDMLPTEGGARIAQRGVTVNVVSPGATDDSVLSGLPSEIFQMIKDWHESGWTPMRRMGTPADIGNAVAMLCSEKAGFITGQTIHVDGGASVMDPVFPLPIQGIS